jgi:hypothetical protein
VKFSAFSGFDGRAGAEVDELFLSTTVDAGGLFTAGGAFFETRHGPSPERDWPDAGDAGLFADVFGLFVAEVFFSALEEPLSLIISFATVHFTGVTH